MSKSQSLSKSSETSIVSTPNIDDFLSSGFIEESVIKVGNPDSKEGVYESYVGQLIGPGADIELADGVSHMPTWLFNPVMKLANGAYEVATQVVNSIIASSQLDAAYKRAMALKLATGKDIWVGAQFIEKGVNSKGQPLNKFRIFSKQVA